MKRLRLAVIGAGHLGRLHVRKLRALADVEVVAVVDPLEASRAQAAAECGGTSLADYRELPQGVEAAVVATPTSSHHQVALHLLEQGLHLLVEKPLAADARQADVLVQAARRRGVVLQVGHSERFNPAYNAVLPHVREPKYITATRLGIHSGRSTDIGVVLDLMIHDIDLILSLVRSSVQRVEALGVSLLGRYEDLAQARLVFDNGCLADLTASRASYRVERSMQLWWSRGFAALDLAAQTATVVRPGEALLKRQFDLETVPQAERLAIKDRLFGDLLPREEVAVEPADALTAELADFVDSIRQLRPPRVTGEQGRDAVRVAEQVLDAIACHSWNGRAAGPIGPWAGSPPHVISVPHWERTPLAPRHDRKEAG